MSIPAILKQADAQFTPLQAEALRLACTLYREASIQSHSRHWDNTMQGGLGCPECIQARELREKADKLLEEVV